MRNALSKFLELNLAASKKINPILTKLLPYTEEYLRNMCLNFYKNILSVTMILSQLNMVAFLMALGVVQQSTPESLGV